MPKISVLMPVYNNKDDVCEAIESVLNQTFTDWELIIIDDGSTDNLEDKIKSFLSSLKDPRIIFIRFEKNRGVYVCLNEGLLTAKGDYITRVDSDDRLPPTKLEKQKRILDTMADVQIVQTKFTRKRADNGYGEVTLMYRKDIIDKVGYYDSVRFGGDTEFLERIFIIFGYKTVYKINEILYVAKTREESLTTSSNTGFGKLGKKARRHYQTEYRRWHRSGKSLKLTYPLISRPFEIYDVQKP